MMQRLPPVTFAFLRWGGAFLFLLSLALPRLFALALDRHRPQQRLAYLGLRDMEAVPSSTTSVSRSF